MTMSMTNECSNDRPSSPSIRAPVSFRFTTTSLTQRHRFPLTVPLVWLPPSLGGQLDKSHWRAALSIEDIGHQNRCTEWAPLSMQLQTMFRTYVIYLTHPLQTHAHPLRRPSSWSLRHVLTWNYYVSSVTSSNPSMFFFPFRDIMATAEPLARFPGFCLYNIPSKITEIAAYKKSPGQPQRSRTTRSGATVLTESFHNAPMATCLFLHSRPLLAVHSPCLSRERLCRFPPLSTQPGLDGTNHCVLISCAELISVPVRNESSS